MTIEPTVQVHAFRLFGNNFEDYEIAPFKATPEAIQALGGEPMEGTEQAVPRSELDEHGHYRRVATAWGELAD